MDLVEVKKLRLKNQCLTFVYGKYLEKTSKTSAFI